MQRRKGRPQKAHNATVKVDSSNVDEKWEGLPSRIIRFAERSKRDIGMRIFREVVLRIPLSTGDGGVVQPRDIERLLSGFGSCEYITCLNDDPQCHIVKFDEGQDAVRAYLGLTGCLLEPVTADEKVGDANASEESPLRKTDSPLPQHNLAELAEELQQYPMISLDFFRFSQNLEAPKSRCSMLSESCRPSVAQIKACARNLREQEENYRSCIAALVTNGIEWEEFTLAVGLIGFLYPCVNPVRTARTALEKCNYDFPMLLNWIDVAKKEDEFTQGSPRRSTREKRRLFPLSPQAKMFLLLMFLLAALAFLLKLVPIAQA